MKNNTKGNDGSQNRTPQNKHLSFYEENYILEPEDPRDENGKYVYDEQAYDLGFLDFSCN